MSTLLAIVTDAQFGVTNVTVLADLELKNLTEETLSVHLERAFNDDDVPTGEFITCDVKSLVKVEDASAPAAAIVVIKSKLYHEGNATGYSMDNLATVQFTTFHGHSDLAPYTWKMTA